MPIEFMEPVTAVICRRYDPSVPDTELPVAEEIVAHNIISEDILPEMEMMFLQRREEIEEMLKAVVGPIQAPRTPEDIDRPF